MRTELLALVLAGLASCKCGTESRDQVSETGVNTGRPTATVVDVPKSVPLAGKEFFRLDPAPQQPACAVGQACEARLILTALGDYHVNDQYPFKLVAEPTPGVKVEGTGTFSPGGKTGTHVLAFRADKPGTAKIAGTFKLSVCNEKNCQIESPKIAFDVSVR